MGYSRLGEILWLDHWQFDHEDGTTRYLVVGLGATACGGMAFSICNPDVTAVSLDESFDQFVHLFVGGAGGGSHAAGM